jgi:hypothetical protein
MKVNPIKVPMSSRDYGFTTTTSSNNGKGIVPRSLKAQTGLQTPKALLILRN